MKVAKPQYALSVIVPISRMGGRLSLLFSWIPDAVKNQVKVILVHDFRDEQTSLELREFVSIQDSTSIVLIEDTFGAPGKARNAGLNFVESKWVAFWDSDDFPHLSAVLSQIKSPGSSRKKVIIGAFEVVNTENNEMRKECLFRGPQNSWINQLSARPGLWRFVIDRSLLKGQAFSDLRMGEDQLLVEELLQNPEDFLFFNEITYSYYVGNSLQATRNKEALKDLKPLVLKSFELYASSKTEIRKLLVPYLGRQIFSNFKYLGAINGAKLIKQIVSNFGITSLVSFIFILIKHFLSSLKVIK